MIYNILALHNWNKQQTLQLYEYIAFQFGLWILLHSIYQLKTEKKNLFVEELKTKSLFALVVVN